MGELQQALDRSLERATAFTRSLFEDEQRWDATAVSNFVNAIRNMTVATTTASGGPHAGVVIAACLDEWVHFTVAPRSLLGRNLADRPAVAFTIADRAHAVMGRGTAVLAARSLEDSELIERLARATASGTFTPPGWDGLVYRIEIDRIFAS